MSKLTIGYVMDNLKNIMISAKAPVIAMLIIGSLGLTGYMMEAKYYEKQEEIRQEIANNQAIERLRPIKPSSN